MRKLASIQEIINIKPIEGADRIEVATILGWEVVIKKDEFKIGDKVVYVEIDSILPDKPEFEFMRDRKFRVKTIKLRKQISQGIVFPLLVLPKKNYNVDDDVTDIIGIVKYDPQAQQEQDEDNRKQNKITKYLKRYSWFRRLFIPKKDFKGFPSFINKTDEVRVQNIPHIVNDKNSNYVVSEKLEGQSGTWVLIKKEKTTIEKLLKRNQTYEFIVCSRNVRKGRKFDGSSYWNIANQYDIENKLKLMIGEYQYIALQGEIIGDGIQKNIYNIDGYDMYLFNYITPEGKFSSFEVEDLLIDNGFKIVPVLFKNFTLPNTVQEIVEMAKGNSVLKNIKREGIVFRNPETNQSFKSINPDYLLGSDL